jgi:zinc D-Ala-D-Ala carboxypeptidase
MFRKIYLAPVLAILAILAAGLVAHHQNATNPSKHTSATATRQRVQKTGSLNKSQYSTTDPSSSWVVVNKPHPLNPISYAPTDLTDVGNGQQMRAEAATALNHMLADAAVAGFTLVADSGYRSYTTQVGTYNGYVKQWGQAYTDTVSARPGYSEHQTGWAVDVGTGNCHVADCFADTPGGKWAQANAYKYGFILRYPPSLTNITGYSNEAWHFRYVGPALSQEMHNENVPTLEQFFGIAGGSTYK